MAEAPQVPAQDVRKLFVVGLGTTGTDVCELLAERLEDEFGSVDNAPWVQFLCFETDAAKGGNMSQSGRLRTLSIDSGEYRGMLANPGALEQQIGFSKYWDSRTLNNIPDIKSGVGNVRMAGRLSFLYPSNFSEVERLLPSAIGELAALSAASAAERRGPLPGGHNPPIHFLGEGSAASAADSSGPVVVVVVGTLCGGTCSGLCVDMGYYLRFRCPKQHHMAIFSLPRPDLSPAVFTHADRFKANAYAALRELHHFSQIEPVTYTVKYPNLAQEHQAKGQQPYEAIQLGWPRSGGPEGRDALNAAIAERLFLLSFAGTDLFASLIDCSKEYKSDGEITHTTFGSFGLSTMEHPGPRLVDHCAHRLLGHTFDRWSTASHPSARVEAELMSLGLTWERLRSDVLLHANGIEQALQAKCDRALKTLEKNPANWGLELNQLRLAFGDTAGVEQDPSLTHGSVIQALRQAQSNTVSLVVGRVANWISTNLMQWDCGPSACLSVVDAAINWLGQMLSHTRSDDASDSELRQASNTLDALKHDRWVTGLGLYRRAAIDVVGSTAHPLRVYVTNRLDAAILKVFASGVDMNRLPEPGILEQAKSELIKMRQRLTRLQQSLSIAGRYHQERSEALKVVPSVNGVVLMKDGDAERGYNECLAPKGDATAIAEAQDKAGVSILGQWNDLPASILVRDKSFWDSPAPTGDVMVTGPSVLPEDTTQKLFNRARERFQRLKDDDVMTKWASSDDPMGTAHQLLTDSSYFINPNLAAASALLGVQPPNKKIAICPDTGANQVAVQNFTQPLDIAWERKGTQNKYRATLLQDCYGLPLESIPGIVSAPGVSESLEAARFDKWATMARKDIILEPLSPTDRSRLGEYRRVLAVAIVLEILHVEGGVLIIEDYPRRSLEDSPSREFPNHLEEAARQWALTNQDRNLRDLSGLYGELQGRLAVIRSPRNQGDLGFVTLIEKNLAHSGSGMREWKREVVGRLVSEYCRNDSQLRPILFGIFGPSSAVKTALFYNVGENSVVGERKNAGYYCINQALRCDAFLGVDDQAAANREWTCPTCHTEYHSMDTEKAYKPEWIDEARRLKATNLAVATRVPESPFLSSDSLETSG